MAGRYAVVTVGALQTLHGATLRSWRLYCWLSAFANATGHCWPSSQALIAATGIDRRDLQRAMRELERLGLVTAVVRGDGRTGTRYYLPHRDGTDLDEGGAESAPGGAGDSAPSGAGDLTAPRAGSLPARNRPREQTKRKDPPSIPPQAGGELPTFLDFWECYPRKQGRQAAEKAWRKLAPDLATCEAIDAALTWQVPLWAKDNYQFAPHASTYLNGRRFEDLPPDRVLHQHKGR